METFSKARDFAEHPRYQRDRSKVLSRLKLRKIDAPIRDLVKDLGKLPHCFTLQCCYGHFLWKGQTDPHSLVSLPGHNPGPVRYRIAYLALCIEQGGRGAYLRDRFAEPFVRWMRNMCSLVLRVGSGSSTPTLMRCK
jgi:hypothetical protein